MTSMKFVKMLTLALGLVTLATAPSYAFVPFAASSTINMMNIDAQTGQIGAILLTPISAGTVGAGEVITMSLPNNVPISSFFDISVSFTGTNTTGGSLKECFGTALGSPYTMVGTALNTVISAAGTQAYGLTIGPGASGVSVTINQYSIVLTFNNAVTFATTDAINIGGIRVDPTGMAVPGGNLQVSLMAMTGQATLNLSQLYVATFVPEANTMTLTGVAGVNGTAGALKFYANGTAFNQQNLVTLTLKEGFANAFETRTSGSTPAWNYTRIRIPITFPAGLPLTVTGVTLAGPDGATFQNGQYWGLAVTTNPLQVSIVNQNAATINSLQIGLTFGVTAGGMLPLSTTPITFTAYLDTPPIATTNPGPYTTLPYSNQQYYNGTVRYKAPATPWISGSIPVNFQPLTSNLFSQYNTAIHAATSGFMYDTGFAISNLSGGNPSTTTFPVGTPGTITAYMYPMDGSGPIIYTTSSTTPAAMMRGLDANGALPSKGTWTVLLSQILGQTTFPATSNFTGFVRFTCNFQAAAGVAYVGDGNFIDFAVGFPMASDTPTQINTSNQIIPPVFN